MNFSGLCIHRTLSQNCFPLLHVRWFSVISLVLRSYHNQPRVWGGHRARADLPGLQTSGHLQLYLFPFLRKPCVGHQAFKEAPAPVLFQLTACSTGVMEDEGHVRMQSCRPPAMLQDLSKAVTSLHSTVQRPRACSKAQAYVCGWTKRCCAKASSLHVHHSCWAFPQSMPPLWGREQWQNPAWSRQHSPFSHHSSSTALSS